MVSGKSRVPDPPARMMPRRLLVTGLGVGACTVDKGGDYVALPRR